MDKKIKYQQPNAKGTTTDAKKNQEITNSKPSFPKSSRKREPAGSAGNNSKYDQSKRSSNYNAQKGKNVDKRPKPKGYYHGGTKEDSKVVIDDLAELGSVMVPGSKKQNLNHLLNFHYEPRDAISRWSHRRTSGFNNHNHNRWLPPIQRHKYNKEQFLQANCQFVVTANGNYSLYLNNPDALIDWDLIQQIRIRSSENLSCPICLSPPVAGRMTRCGHVYCWPCMLHYLALSDKTWRKCPICYESIHKADLKSVTELTDMIYNTGDEVSLRLMRREKGSLIALPVENIEESPPTTFLSISENPTRQMYSKLLLANIDDIINIIKLEKSQLFEELMIDTKSPENCFIEQALEELAVRERVITESTAESMAKPSSPLHDYQDITDSNAELNQNRTVDTSLNLEDAKKFNNSEINHNVQNFYDESTTKFKSCLDSNSLSTNDIDNVSSNKKFHYFYQAEDGQNVYLHAVNIKMLEMQYGSLENCPRLISGKLLEKEVGSLTEDLRKRMRYLCHLPLTCQFEIAEIELKQPLVSKEVLNHFEDQLTTRQRKRQRSEREERKREKKIAEEENKRMGKYPKPDVHIESQHHFPDFINEHQQSNEVNIPTPEVSTSSSSASSPSTSNFEEIAAASIDMNNWSSDNTRSFAATLKNKDNKIAWPSLKPNSKPPINTVSATVVTQSSDITLEDPEMEQFLPPIHSRSLGDALAEALEKTNFLNPHESSSAEKGGGKKKKKKTKATVLFATNMARAS